MRGGLASATGSTDGSGTVPCKPCLISCSVLHGWTISFDARVVNPGFDEGCRDVSRGGQILSRLQGGRVQSYLRMIGFALIVLVLFLLWGARG